MLGEPFHSNIGQLNLYIIIIRRVTQNECYGIMLENACSTNIKQLGLTFSIFDKKT